MEDSGYRRIVIEVPAKLKADMETRLGNRYTQKEYIVALIGDDLENNIEIPAKIRKRIDAQRVVR